MNLSINQVRIELDELCPLDKNSLSQLIDVTRQISRWKSSTKATFNVSALNKLRALQNYAKGLDAEGKQEVEQRIRLLAQVRFHVSWDYGTCDRQNRVLTLRNPIDLRASFTKKERDEIRQIIASQKTLSKKIDCSVPLAMRLKEISRLPPKPANQPIITDFSAYITDDFLDSL